MPSGTFPPDRMSSHPAGPVSHSGPEVAPATSVIPPPANRLIGRERDTLAVHGALSRDNARLLTITGPGGVGKTRLANHVAQRLAQEGAWAVVSVELAALRDPDAVLRAIASALGLMDLSGHPIDESLATYLRDRPMLIVLDTCEHLLDAGPALADLVATCPELRILATSRVRFRLSTEREHPIAPLPVPEAVQLFVSRARLVQANFAVGPDNAATIAAICSQLDGLPLAIELAAARLRSLSLGTLHDQLGRALPVLTGGPRDYPRRLQTMRNAIAWSFDLLSADERRLFCHLSLFVGGIDLDAAEAVAGTSPDPPDIDARIADRGDDPVVLGISREVPQLSILDGIDALVEHNLLIRVDPLSSSTTRYRMFDTVREYAAEQLHQRDDRGDAVRRFVAWARDLVESTSEHVWLQNSVAVLRTLDTEHPNILAAMSVAGSDGFAEAYLRIARGLANYWSVRSRYAEAVALGNRSLDLADDRPSPTRGRMHAALGWLATMHGDPIAARHHLRTARDMAETIADRMTLGSATLTFGLLALDQGDLDAAMDLTERAVAIYTDVEHVALAGQHYLGSAYARAGDVARARGEPAKATAYLEQALERFRTLGLHLLLSGTLRALGDLQRDHGDAMAAGQRYAESFQVASDLGLRYFVAGAVSGMASLCALRGAPLRAAELFGAAAQLNRSIGVPDAGWDRAGHERRISAVRSSLGGKEFHAAWARGQTWTEDDIAAAVGRARPDAALAPAQPRDDPAREQDRALLATLTARERDVLRLLALGRSDSDIADVLSISTRTVNGHVANLLGKLGVKSRTAAAVLALRVEPDSG